VRTTSQSLPKEAHQKTRRGTTTRLSHPDVTVEIGNETFLATARLLTGDERAQAFAKAMAMFPPYGEYQKKTTRELPVFLLERGTDA
jgi:deazaflavin-dependent oxidoreductase (nitroreductase family)